MSSSIFTPLNKVKLTDVSVVRLKKGGKRFELACQQNRITDWRSGRIKRLDDVLQIEQVFVNVSKGELAKKEDMEKVFGKNLKMSEVIEKILREGEVQISAKEWGAETEKRSKEIAQLVADRCLNPNTRLPYPSSVIEKAIQEVGFAVHPDKAAKAQALEVIAALTKRQDKLPIVRARMRVIIDAPMEGKSELDVLVRSLCMELEDVKMEEEGASFRMTALLEPGNYRPLAEQVTKTTKGKGGVHVLSMKE